MRNSSKEGSAAQYKMGLHCTAHTNMPTSPRCQRNSCAKNLPMSQFVQNIQYPKEFPGLLMDLCREVLREQPENIYEFAANHFRQLKQGLDAEKDRNDA